MKNTLVLAHYYTIPEVQQLADFVGDSLDLSLRAQESKAERIVFAGVKFMAETAKIINPQAEVIIPNIKATCSLVTQSMFKTYKEKYNLKEILENIKLTKSHTIVTYINSSVKIKALSDIIVTSANVEDIVSNLIALNQKVFFTPDRNMGAYLASQNLWGYKFDYYKDAVCDVHDKFKKDELLKAMNSWSDYGNVVIAHPESPLPVLKLSDFVGSTKQMIKYINDFTGKQTIYVATEEGLLYNMRKARPDLDIKLAPTYMGCQCNSCPYMKMNTVKNVQGAIDGTLGTEINYISEELRLKALKPIKRMLEWQHE